MSGLCYLAALCTLLLTHPGLVCGELLFIERNEGESVVLHCAVEPTEPSPYGVYLKRSWLRPGEVLFKFQGEEHITHNPADKNRSSVSGEPDLHSLNITLSQLRPADSDRYYCDFMVSVPSSEDTHTQGKTEYFLLVTADALGLVDVEPLQTCAGGSAVIPCLPPHGEGSAVEGVSLKRQKGQAPVEVLYHSQQPSSSSSEFPMERVRLSSVPGPRGLSYSLTLLQLRPEDSALYSCQLLLPGRKHSSSSLGRRVHFVSVQGGEQCSCSSYSILLYALSSAVAVLFLLLVVVFVVIYKGKARRSVKSHPSAAPIYEEMVGVKPPSHKLASHHLEEALSSEYRNCSLKKSCPENNYESPRGFSGPGR